MSYFINKQNQYIAYKKIEGRKPGIVFIHGYNSDMEGEKALHIEKFAKKKKLSFLRFDCRGHGKSQGKIDDYLITDWKNDLIDMINNKTKGKQILIGSSMGGWLMMLAAKSKKLKIAGLIGIAAAPDFTAELLKNLPQRNKKELIKKNITTIKKWGVKYIFTRKFFIDGRKNFVTNKKFIFSKPIILLHGTKDDIVPLTVPQNFLNKVKNRNIQLRILKNSDHRLSKKNDLKNISNALENMLSII